MMDEYVDELVAERPGKVTIDPSVLVTIARLSTLSVSGVCRMAEHTPGRVWGAGGVGKGTRVMVADRGVTVDLYIIVHSGMSMLEVGRAVQAEVTRAIEDMVGMLVSEVNVHIKDVQFACPGDSLQE